MPRLRFYICKDCNWGIELLDYGDGWIDENGNFGHCLHPGGEIIGNPIGEFKRIMYLDRYCLNCEKNFNIVKWNDKGYKLKLEQSYTDEKKRTFHYNVIDEKDNNETCPFCGEQFYNFDTIEELVKSKSPKAKCKKCKKKFLKKFMNGIF